MATLWGCQTESLDIRAPYRIRLNAGMPGQQLRVHQPYAIPLELLTDSYYQKYGYELVYYQASGLGKLRGGSDTARFDVLQKVPVPLALGGSSWQFTPAATGACQVVLVAQQARGYTLPDTVQMNFQVVP
jgi:hypothetical protein